MAYRIHIQENTVHVKYATGLFIYIFRNVNIVQVNWELFNRELTIVESIEHCRKRLQLVQMQSEKGV